MVTQLLGIKIHILTNMFRHSPAKIVAIICGLVVACSGLLIGGAFFITAADSLEVVRNAMIIGGSVVFVGFIVVPLMRFVDDAMDPRIFSLLGFSSQQLSRGLFVTSLVSVPALCVTFLLLASLVVWSGESVSLLWGLVSLVVSLISCVLAGRVSASVAALMLASRWGREISIALGIAVCVVLPVLGFVVLNGHSNAAENFSVLAEILSWTPVGAMWALPGDAALGHIGVFLKCAIAIISTAVLWVGWDELVNRMFYTRERKISTKVYSGLGWFASFPARPWGVIAARSATSWLRDSRYIASLAVLPLLLLVVPVSLLIAGVSGQWASLAALPVMCLFLGFAIHNDVSYDYTSVWLDLVSATDGLSDRIGRVIPVLILGVPLIAVGSCGSVFLSGDWTVLPSLIGVSSALLLSGAGFSSFTSARFPYPAPKPGDGPFAHPHHVSDSTPWLIHCAMFCGAVLVSAPALTFTWLGFTLEASFHWAALWVGVSAGIVALIGGIAAGAYAYDKRAPEIMAAALRA